MTDFVMKVKRFIESEAGPTATEYAVMLALIVVIAIVAIQMVGQNASTTFNTTAASLNTGS